jgi:hypothetical protein
VIRCLKSHIDKIVEGVSAGRLFPEIPTVHFTAQGDCCSGDLRVLKTRQKKVVTLDVGPLQAKETVLRSPRRWYDLLLPGAPGACAAAVYVWL